MSSGSKKEGAPANVPLTPPKRALAIGAHPDDVEFGAGATLARWAAAGTDITLLVLTDGSKGTWDSGTDRSGLVRTRQEEQRAAADILGIRAVEFLGRTDGDLVSTVAERALVSAVIRRCRPDVVLGHDPWRRYRLHPDHQRAGTITIEAIVAARDATFHAEQIDPGGLVAHRPATLLLFEPEEPNHCEPADEGLAAKVDALLAHRSQWRSTMGIDTDPDAEIAAFATRVRDTALDVGDGVPAEEFHRIDDL